MDVILLICWSLICWVEITSLTFKSGGSFVFTAICAFLIFLNIITKKYNAILRLWITILLLLIVMNFLGYQEAHGEALSIQYLAVYFVLYLIVFFVWVAAFRVYFPPKANIINNKDSEAQSDKKIWERIYSKIWVAPFIMFMFIFVTIAFFGAVIKKNMLDRFTQSYFSFIDIASFWLIIGNIIGFISFRGVSGEYINYSIDTPKTSMPYFKKTLIIISIVILIFGTVFEVNRGMWSLWFLTYMFLFSMVILHWRIWKYIFYPKDINQGLDYESLPLPKIESMILKVFLISVVGTLIYAGILLCLLFI